MRMYYSLTTLDPIILSQTTATTNNHQGLDFIPGSSILGMVAAQVYSQIPPDQSWHLFHSGLVQFGPAYISENGDLALPLPASWHFPKGEEVFSLSQSEGSDEQGQRLQSCVENHALEGGRSASIQFKQCRSGYITSNGVKGEVKQGRTTKTALNRLTGAVMESQLFSYTYIEKNQTFIGWVECDAPEHYDLLKNALEGVRRIGRSRGSEFGRVKISLLSEQIEPQVIQANQLTLWCLSDCQCLDRNGLPTLTPALSELLASSGINYDGYSALNGNLSFIRSHTTTLFNQKRAGFDSEQRLITKGSVLVYDNVDLSVTQLEQLNAKGVGINRQQGLGWVSVNPSWSFERTLSPVDLFDQYKFELFDKPTASVAAATEKTSQLIAWVCQLAGKQRADQNIDLSVKQDLSDLYLAYKTARHYNRIIHAYQAGPSSNQWRRVSELFRYAEGDWFDALFVGENAICKADNDPLGWGLSWDNGQRFITFADQFKHIVRQAIQSHEKSILDEENHTDTNVKAAALYRTTKQMQVLIERLCRYDFSIYSDLNRFAKHHQPTSVVKEAAQ